MSKGQLVILDSNLLLPGDMNSLEAKIKEDSGQEITVRTKALFSGHLEEDKFWQELKEESGVDDFTVNSWREWMREDLVPREEIKHLESWRKNSNVGLSANYFAPWMRRSLKDADVLRHIKYTWISSETGQLKPDPDVFTAAFALGLDTLYLDRDEANLHLAAGYGFEVVLAADNWPKAVDLWID